MNEPDSGEKKPSNGGKLSQAELRERSRKGLCFKCGDILGRDHVCKLKHYQFVLIEGSQGDKSEISDEEGDKGEPLTNKVLQLSLHSKEGFTSNTSFKVVDMLRGREVLIWVNCGASANFISQTLVKQLNLTVNDTKAYEVEVGTGAKVRNRGISGNPSHGGPRAHILDFVWLRW